MMFVLMVVSNISVDLKLILNRKIFQTLCTSVIAQKMNKLLLYYHVIRNPIMFHSNTCNF